MPAMAKNIPSPKLGITSTNKHSGPNTDGHTAQGCFLDAWMVTYGSLV